MLCVKLFFSPLRGFLVDAHYVWNDLFVNGWWCREKAEKEVAQKGASEAAREREQKEAAIRSVDELRRAATKQGESYDILVSTFEMGGGRQGSVFCMRLS